MRWPWRHAAPALAHSSEALGDDAETRSSGSRAAPCDAAYRTRLSDRFSGPRVGTMATCRGKPYRPSAIATTNDR